MAFTGQVLDNPISGERFVFHQTASDTGGQLLAFDLVLTPDGHVPGGHVHPVQEERFQVLRGTMKFRPAAPRHRRERGARQPRGLGVGGGLQGRVW
jgi:quercetin dioxygenase-like cupin family protein